MKIAIFGAGSMGSLIGGLLQHGGAEVTFIGRGSHLRAMQARGLTVDDGNERIHMPVNATDDAATAGTQDAVIICTKAHQLSQAAEDVQPLLRDDTMIIPAINGVPWWYFYKEGGAYDGRSLTLLDPDERIATLLPADNIIGCVNYLAGHIAAPGVVSHVPPTTGRLAIGEIDGSITPRLRRLGEALDAAGFAPKISDNIRQVVWHKLWGNISFNPIGALTHGTIDQIALGYRDSDLLMAVMNEARFIADKLGVELGQTLQKRIDGAAKMVGHKTSMLQDIEAGKPTEIDAIVGVVREMGRWMQADTPYLNTLYSLVKLKEQFYIPAASKEAVGQSDAKAG